jgi:hypothetical protein
MGGGRAGFSSVFCLDPQRIVQSFAGACNMQSKTPRRISSGKTASNKAGKTVPPEPSATGQRDDEHRTPEATGTNMTVTNNVAERPQYFRINRLSPYE